MTEQIKTLLGEVQDLEELLSVAHYWKDKTDSPMPQDAFEDINDKLKTKRLELDMTGYKREWNERKQLQLDKISESAKKVIDNINKHETDITIGENIELKGTRHFSTGAKRDDDTGKPKLTFIPWDIIDRVANHYEQGTTKFGDSNWRMGIPSSTVLDSLMRHVRAYYMGQDDEDHLSAIVFNALCLIYNEDKMSDNSDVYDLPKWWKDRGFR